MVKFNFTKKSEELKTKGTYLLGIPFDGGCEVGKGSRFAPGALRLYSRVNETYSMTQKLCIHDFKNIFDLGNLEISANLSDQEAYSELKSKFNLLAENMSNQTKLITIGGDHSISIAPISKYLNLYPNLKILHLDAHSDCIDRYMDKEYSNASVFHHISRKITKQQEIIQYGVRAMQKSEVNFVEKHISSYSSLSDLITYINQTPPHTPWYISLDVDFFDPSYLPGTGCPVPGGESYDSFLKILKAFNEKNLVGADITELSPSLDKSNISTVFVSTLLKELIIQIAKGN